MMLKFAFNEAKAIEVLAFIAEKAPGLTPFYVSKVLFYAEKWHLNRFGRPIIADTYVAMPDGPVPSTIKNFLDGNWEWIEEPDGLDQAVKIDRSGRRLRLNPGTRPVNTDLLSTTDMDCLLESIGFCKDKSFTVLSRMTHFEKAWKSAEPNRYMDYADFIDDDNPNRDEIIAIAEETAAYGVF